MGSLLSNVQWVFHRWLVSLAMVFEKGARTVAQVFRDRRIRLARRNRNRASFPKRGDLALRVRRRMHRGNLTIVSRAAIWPSLASSPGRMTQRPFKVNPGRFHGGLNGCPTRHDD